VTPLRSQAPRSQHQPSLPPVRLPAELQSKAAPSVAAIDAPAFEPDLPALELALRPAPSDALETVLDFASIHDRYPLLRNAL
jgi:hypothetical protein